MVRAVLVNRDSMEMVAAAECGVAITGDRQAGGGLDGEAVAPAIDDVLYQLGIEDRNTMVAAVSIGPDYSGVGSGPALPAWLDHQARQLGENLVCAGDLGVAFCPQSPVDTVINLAEKADLTVARIDLAAVAAARLLEPGAADVITIGSGRGWRARLRNDEVLEALQSSDVDADQPMVIVGPDGVEIGIEQYHHVAVAQALAQAYDLNLGQLAPSVGAAFGHIHSSPANLLDGQTITGRDAVVASVGSAAVYNSAEAGRTTVDLHRESTRSMMSSGSATTGGGRAATAADVHVNHRAGDRIEIDHGSIDADVFADAVASADTDTDIDLTRVERRFPDDRRWDGTTSVPGESRSDGYGLSDYGAGRSADSFVGGAYESDRRPDDYGVGYDRADDDADPFGADNDGGKTGRSGVESRNDLIESFSPDPESERKLADDRRITPKTLVGLLVLAVVIGLIVFFFVL